MSESNYSTAVASPRSAWKPTLVVFAVGAAVWAAQFVWAWLLFKRGSQWYPGLAQWGGEWRGWQGLGWSTEQIFCFGTQEMCANFDSSRTFHFQPFGTLVFFAVLAVISVVIGRGVAAGRRSVNH